MSQTDDQGVVAGTEVPPISLEKRAEREWRVVLQDVTAGARDLLDFIHARNRTAWTYVDTQRVEAALIAADALLHESAKAEGR